MQQLPDHMWMLALLSDAGLRMARVRVLAAFPSVQSPTMAAFQHNAMSVAAAATSGL